MNSTVRPSNKQLEINANPAISIPVKALLWVTLFQLFSHQSHAPVWLSVFIILIAVFKYLAEKTHVSKIPFLLRALIMLSATGVFVLYYKTNFSVDMAASFLFLAAVLKLLEIEKQKDVIVFVFSMMYLSAVSFLFEQSILHALLQFITLSVCFYVLFVLTNSGQGAPDSRVLLLRLHGKAMFKMLIFALPIVVVLFLFFPRIAPLWQMPIKTQTAKTGMSSELSPGDVSKLAKSSETAFRVTFSGAVPAKPDRYWRGLILDHFDGRKWIQSSSRNLWERRHKVDAGKFFETLFPSYQVMMAPHQQRWVFALEGSSEASSNVIDGDMGLFKLKTDAIQPTRYQMQLNPERLSKALSNIPTGFRLSGVKRNNSPVMLDLQLPPGSLNPRSQAYIKALSASTTDKIQLATKLLNHFTEEPFFYTLEPPVVGTHFVDEFFFESRRGFCEHYASSLAYMLRLASIPSRVVLGYQGGEFNPQSDYLIVAQYDAHAWVEAYFEDLGWVRLDPTAMVAPQRILDGSGQTLSNEAGFLEDSPFAAAAMKNSLLNWARLKVDQLNFQWQTLVVNYNQDQQESFITQVLGENTLLRIALFFVYVFIIIFLSMLLYLGFRHFSAYTWPEKQYIIWLLVLSRFGLVRRNGETPRAFLKRIQETRHKRLAAITENRTRKLEERQYR
jgi:transglutaminase-like putative cysteine protease